MRLLFLNRCYFPDVEATGQLLHELCSGLAAGHDVTVIAGQPNFVGAPRTAGLFGRETHAGVRVLRARNLRFTKKSFVGRVVGLASYLVLALYAGLVSRRPDVIVVETDPPVLGALGALLKWWHRCPLIFYLQDLFPEVGLITGRLRPGLLTALLRWTTQLGLHRADRVVVLGEDMRQRVLQRGIDPAKIAVVPNWMDTAAVRPVKENNPLRQQWGLNGDFTVMYSGNLGLSQNLEQVLAAARELRGEPVRFLFVGEGAAKAGLMARAAEWGLDNVRFLPYQPKECLGESLSAADLHLITLQRGLAGYIVPSKLYGILAAGTAYVAALDRDSEVGRITETGKTGLLIEPDAPEQLADAIRWGLGHRTELAEMGERGREVAEAQFDRQKAVQKFDRVITEAAGASSGVRRLDAASDRATAPVPGSVEPPHSKGRAADLPVLHIRPTPGWRAVDLRELWRYRELLSFLVWRDLKVRYKQTVLGVAWAVIQPLFPMLVFTLFFGKLAQMPSEGIPYALFSFIGLLPWTYFANSLGSASNSLVGGSHLITKVYFPRLLIPSAAVLAALVDYFIAFSLVIPLMLWHGFVPPAAALVTVPLLTLLTTALALGISLWLSALNVQYRDIRYVVPFAVQLWMFASPIVYPLNLVPPAYRWLAALNPIAGIVEGYRSALLGREWDGLALAVSVVAAAVTLVTGAFYFRRAERTFAEVV